MQSGKVTIYNPFKDQEQIYEWEDFKEAWQDEGSHTVYNYAAVIASPPVTVATPTATPTLTLTPTPTNTVAPTVTPKPAATAVPEKQETKDSNLVYEFFRTSGKPYLEVINEIQNTNIVVLFIVELPKSFGHSTLHKRSPT